jgi:hypothetical protein
MTDVTPEDPWHVDGADRQTLISPAPIPPGQDTAQRQATEPARGADGYHKKAHGSGLVTFAGHWLGVSAIFNLVYGVGALMSQHVAHAHYMFSILHLSGWIAIILGIAQLAVAAWAVMGNQLARWLGVALLTLNAINQQFFIGTYPAWSVLIILLDTISIGALCLYGSRKNLARPE